MLARLKKLFKRKPNYPVAVYVRGRLVHAGNATITTGVDKPFTVVFEEPLEKLLDNLIDPTFLDRATKQ